MYNKLFLGIMYMIDDDIPKNKPNTNLDNMGETLSDIAKNNKMVKIINSLNNKYLNYCPT